MHDDDDDDDVVDDDNDDKYDVDDALVQVPWQGSKSGQKPLLGDFFLSDLENGDDDHDAASDH